MSVLLTFVIKAMYDNRIKSNYTNRVKTIDYKSSIYKNCGYCVATGV